MLYKRYYIKNSEYPLFLNSLKKITKDIYMSKNVVKSSIILAVAGIFCKILGALFRLPLTNILGVKGIGYFQMVMSLYIFTLVLCSGGITITLSKLVAEKDKSKEQRINSLYKISLITSLVLATIVGLAFYVLSDNIAKIQGGEFGPSYKLLVLLLILGGIIACFRGVLQGLERMSPTAISQIIEQAIRFIFGLMFASILVKKSVEFGVFGAFLGIVLGEILSLMYLLFEIKKMKIKFEGYQYRGFYKALLPILIGGSIIPLVNAIDSLIIVNRLMLAGFEEGQAVLLFGIQTGVVGTILNIPAILSSSLAIALLPSLSSLNGENEEQKRKICSSFNYLWVILLPMVLGIMAVAKPLYSLIYPTLDYNTLQYAVNLTLVGGISSILLAIMQFTVTILQAKGELVYLMFLQFIAGFSKLFIVFKFCAVPEINIYGLIFGNIFLSAIVIVGCLVKLKGEIETSFSQLVIPFVSSIVMYVFVSYFVNWVKLPALPLLILSICLGVAVYGLLNFPFISSIFKKIGMKEKINLSK